MTTAIHTTADELVRISVECRARGQRCELIDGEVRYMSPAGWYHGSVASIHATLAPLIVKQRLGRSFSAETGFIVSRDPDTVIAPDFAFIAKENLPEERPTEAYWPGAPDFAVEVLSPSESAREVAAKTKLWLSAGVKVLWVVDPVLETITAYRSLTDVAIYSANQEIEVGELIPEAKFLVGEIFQ